MTTEKIHEIWRRELALDEFGDSDDFFELGGHSLIMTKIQAAILADMGIEVPMDQLFRKSTVNLISAHIEESLARS